MKATVVGMKKVDFMSDNELVKMKKYFLTVDTGEIDEGLEVEVLTFRELNEKGEYEPAPIFNLGQEIEIAYNKRGRARYVEPRKSA
ncbi:MAG: hypothetical protein LBC71_02450 [Oscillospiraceae bacterium]|jgi:hypothetical protein|nr:hypothetical protein [Oscillospiraceae bacterium]